MATTVLVVFEAKPGNGDALYKALSGSDEVMIEAVGCRRAEVLRDAHDPDRVVGIEVWDRPHLRELWIQDQAEVFEPLQPLLARAPEVHYLA